jgi:hypothetical protein
MDDRVRFAMGRALLAGLAGLLCLGLLSASGCVNLPTASSLVSFSSDEPVCRVVCMWERNVQVAQDVIHDGAYFGGLAGTIYFFPREDGPSLEPHGELVAEWYDLDLPIDANTKPLHRQVYEAKALSSMKRKSPVGPAYTVFLDWPNYRPEIKRVLVRVHFNPANGRVPIWANPAQINLHTDMRPTRRETNEQVLLAPGTPVGPAPTGPRTRP